MYRSNPQLATLRREVRGKFTVWPKGMLVKAHYVRGAQWVIERLHQTRNTLPLFNQCCNVPRNALEFRHE